jgi:two-component system, chemotaxis family, response regulator WspF
VKIGIANENVLAAEALRRVIARSGQHEVIWIAYDGAAAVARCERNRPDLLLLDLFLPTLDGVSATREIMTRTPCAIVIATAQVQHHIGKVFEAMGAGALDAVNIPALGEPTLPPVGADELLAKLEIINKLLGAAKSNRRPSSSSPPPAPRVISARAASLIAIGSSAGGPSALTQILAALPADLPASVVIVQHVDKQFAAGLTGWFATHTRLQVQVAAEGDRLEPGHVYLAGRDRHLILFSPTQLGYTSHPADTSYCPSVDVFFRSVARMWRGRAVGVLLTGMGRDGAEGLKAMRDAGFHTIAQDKITSAVYGMPKAAMELDAARDILALDKIAPRLTNIVSKQNG